QQQKKETHHGKKAISPRRSFLIDLHDTMLPKLTSMMIPCLPLPRSAFCLSLSPNLALLSSAPRALGIRHAGPRTQHHSACIFLPTLSTLRQNLRSLSVNRLWL
uniref:Uncharacterized protein n=1 Tax=Aegilops tauschii subsp. strangulata TaxID=200361 RepID=A0A453MHN2_AEGTS